MCNASSCINGSPNKTTGTAFGLKIDAVYKKTVFSNQWQTVQLYLSGFVNNPVTVNLTDAFWSTCPELRSKQIGLWFIQQKKDIWKKGLPYRYTLIQRSQSNVFDVL